MQCIDLFLVHGYTFVNLRDLNNGNAACLIIVLVTLETALSAPRLGRHELVPIVCYNNSIAISHTDWFHGASDFSHFTRITCI